MKQKKKARIGQQIVESLKEFVEELQSGVDIEKTFTCRRVEVNIETESFNPDGVKNTRKMLGASQAVFASFLGVSLQTVRAWEQGTNVPSDIAQRFMYEIRRDPDHWRARLRQMAVPKRRHASKIH